MIKPKSVVWLRCIAALLTALMVWVSGCPIAVALQRRQDSEERYARWLTAQDALLGAGQAFVLVSGDGQASTRAAAAEGEKVSRPALPWRLELLTPGPVQKDAWVLLDRDASTRLQGPVRLRASWPSQTRLTHLSWFSTAEEVGRGVLRVWLGTSKQATAKPIFEGQTVARGVGWQRLALPDAALGNSFIIEWTPLEHGAPGLAELAFWAEQPLAAFPDQETRTHLYTGSAHEGLELLAQPTRNAVSERSPARFGVDLQVPPAIGERAFLVYELLGARHFSHVTRQINGVLAPRVSDPPRVATAPQPTGAPAPLGSGGLQVEEISTDWLKRGMNEIRFSSDTSAGTYFVRNLRLVVLPPPTVRTADLGAAVRVQGRHVWQSEIVFERPTEPMVAAFRLDRPSSGSLVVQHPSEPSSTVKIDLKGMTTGWHQVPIRLPATKELAVAFGGSTETLAPPLSLLQIVGQSLPDESRPLELKLSYPQPGECAGDTIAVGGFVSPTPPPGTRLLVAGADAGELGSGATFSLRRPRPGASAARVETLEAVTPAGARVTSRLELGPCVDAPEQAPRTLTEDPEAPFSALARADKAQRLVLGTATLDIPAGALAEDVRITARPLTPEQVAALGPNMINVMPGGQAYRFGPHGLKFKQPIKLSLSYDPALVPAGLHEREIFAFFFNESSGSWERIGRLAEAKGGELVSLTDHFTDFVAATLAQPDAPGAQSFNPTQMQDLPTADPAAGISLIAAPQADNSGAAQLSHGIEVPPGRGGIAPQLAVGYNSRAGNSWLGMGWDLALSSIEVDTRFGVPRYTGEETYLLDGAMLTPVSGAEGAPTANPRRYQRRVEKSFERILRHGTDPTNYYWEVTDKSGMQRVFGRCPRATNDASCQAQGSTLWSKLDDPRAPAGQGNIYKWFIESQQDLSGNRLEVRYFRDLWQQGERFVQLYPARIDYTSHVSGGVQDLPAAYSVEFELARQQNGALLERQDVMLDGRAGFATAVRYLLGHIDVNLTGGAQGSEIIRRYRFDYKPADIQNEPQHLGKTLLEAITLLGLGAENELYQHTFSYFGAETDAENRPQLFAEQQTWGSALSDSDGLTRTEDNTFGGNGSVGIGIGPFSLTASAGGFSGDDEVKRAMIDITGDGVLDQFDDRQSGVFGFLDRDPMILVPVASGGFSSPSSIVNGPRSRQLGHTDRSGWTVEGGLNLGGIFGASIGYTRTNSTDDHVLADMDGDGFVDLVSIDDGYVQVRRGIGQNQFEASTIAWGAQLPSSELVSSQAARSGVAAEQVHPVDPLIKWVAPIGGTVLVQGSVAKVEAGGDGVTAQLFHNNQLIWQHTFGEGELTPCQPGPSDGCEGGLTISGVTPGDRIYVKATAPVDPNAEQLGTDTLHDDLSFDARFVYDVGEPLASERQPYGALTYQASTLDDFRLAGLPAVPWVASSQGKVIVDGLVDKNAATADDLVVRITKNGTSVFTRDFGSDEVASVEVPGELDVNGGDQLIFEVDSDTPIDPARLTWQPYVVYTEFCRFDRDLDSYVCGNVQCGPESAEDQRVTCRLEGDPDPFIRIPVEVIAQPVQVHYATDQWQPRVVHPAVRFSAAQNVSVESTISKAETDDDVLVVIQGVHRLYYKRWFAADTAGTFSETVDLALPANEQLFFTIYSETDVSGAFGWAPTVDQTTPVVPTLRTRASQLDPMAGGHHNLFYGDYNGSLAFDENLIVAEAPYQGMPFLFVAPRWQGRGNNLFPLWVGRGADGYIGAGRLKPSRLGSLTPGKPGPTGGLSELRVSENWNATLGVTVVANFTGSVGDTTAQLDLVDFNGDQYPDLVTSRGVLINDAPNRSFLARDALGDVDFPSGDFEDMRRFENRSVGVALSAGRQIIQKTDSKGKTKGFVNTAFRLGANYGLTGTATDLLDINGDGLPDHLFKDPNSNQMRVRLNLGYAFSEPFDWQSSDFGVDQITELQELITELPGTDAVQTGAIRLDDTVSLNVGAGVSVGMFGGGAGLTLTTARQNIDFVDVNGDGLLDQVMRDPSEADGAGHEWIRVKLNQGAGFAAEQRWPMPAWTTEVDPGEFLPLDEPIKISGQKALSFRRSRAFSGSFEVNVCVILCVGASFYYQEGSGYSALQFQDVDGDGNPDHVLKKNGDNQLYVKVNQVGKANLLREVTRPLGGSFELDYERVGNLTSPDASPRADMPNAEWVLSSTIVKNAPSATPASTGDYLVEVHAYGTSFYDRAERESYGFDWVKTTRGVFDTNSGSYIGGDGSSTERTFANQNYYEQGLLLETVERGANPDRPELGTDAMYTRETVQYAEAPAQVLAAIGTGSFFPRELTRETTWFEGETNGLVKRKRESNKQYDALGNLTQMLDEGDLDVPGDELLYTIAYDVEASSHTVRPTRVRALTGDADPSQPQPEQILRERSAIYDDKGRILSFTHFLRGGKDPLSADGAAEYDGTNNPTWTFSYQDAQGRDFGNITRSVDPSGFVQTYDFDATTRTHRTRIDNSFGQFSTISYDLRFGVPRVSSDVNGNKMTFCYDEFGRSTRVYGPNDTPPAGTDPCALAAPLEPTLEHAYGVQGTSAAQAPYPAWVLTGQKDVQHPGDPIVKATFIDGAKRIVQTKRDLDLDNGAGSGEGVEATTTGMTVSGLVEFDARGRVTADHQPTFSEAPAEEFIEAPVLNPTLTEYDVLGRIVTVKTANQESTTTRYGIEMFEGTAQFVTRVRDQKQNVRLTYADARGNAQAVVEHNRLGDLAGADHCEPGDPSCTELTTRYAYSPMNELMVVVDAAGNTTEATFDTLGRIVELTSPDAGRTEWSFDLSGNLAAKQTGRLREQSSRITYEYEFNRLTRINYPDMPAVEYVYGAADQTGDEHGNVASRIVEERSEAGTKRYRYDRLGNVVREEVSIVSISEPFAEPYTYAMTFSYDSFNRMLSMKFPGEGEELVEYKYDHGGRIQSIFGNLTQLDPQSKLEPHTDYVRHIGYDEFDQKRRVVSGNGVETNFDYDPVMRRLSNILARSHDEHLRKKNLPPRVFQDLRYEYDAAGNVTEIRNDAPFEGQSNSALLVGTTSYQFEYDDLYQLRRSEGVLQEKPQWQHRQYTNLDYDALGNIVHKEQRDDRYKLEGSTFVFDHQVNPTTYTFDYSYAGVQPHAVSQTVEDYQGDSEPRPRDFEYDASGNMTRWQGHNGVVRSQVWDAENRLKTVNDNGEDVMIAVYDAKGQRANMVSHGEETLYPNQFLTDRYTQGGKHYVTKHIYADGMRLAEKIDASFMNKSPTFHYHGDHLGSSQYVSDGEQNLVEHNEYFASGEQWLNQVDSQYLFRKSTTFNDKEFDAGSGYYAFGARYYEPRLGSFISADPELIAYMQGERNGGVQTPRNLNMYTYAYNNPLMFRDPTGRYSVGEGLYDVFTVALRGATNFLTPAIILGAAFGIAAILTGGGVIAAAAAGFSQGLTWSTSGAAGAFTSTALGFAGMVHGVRLAQADSYKSGVGFLALVLDHTWSLPNTIVGSIFATFTAGKEINKTQSAGSGSLYLKGGIIDNYDTTLGNVTAGNIVPKHEQSHSWQARLFGPFFYPIYAANYAFNTFVPWWLIAKAAGAWSKKPIDSFGRYFTRGVYPFTFFELWAYAIEGSPP